MIGRFADTDLAVMTRCTVIDNAGVLEECRGELSRIMAEGTVLGRRQVGNMFPGANDTVVARGAFTHDAGVIEVTAGECAGCVAHGAIFGCRHMVVCLAGRIGTVVAGVATDRSHRLAAVVDERVEKALRAMACAAVLAGHRMIDRQAGRDGSVVAGDAGLGHGIEKRVVESTARFECINAMAHHAVHACLGMVSCLSDRVNAVVATDTVVRYVAVVDIRRQEPVCRVTKAALTFGGDVPGVHAGGRGSVVASGAGAGIGAMVEAATGQAIQEVIGIVAFIARFGRRNMKLRFSDGQNTVVALAADAKDFLMIHREDRRKPQG